jgi:RHS repeat-associated protein
MPDTSASTTHFRVSLLHRLAQLVTAGFSRGSQPAARHRLAMLAAGGVLLVGVGGTTAGWGSRVLGLAARARRAAMVAPGDTVTVFGPKQYNGSSGQGQTYVDRFTTTPTAGRQYTLHLVNGAADGTHRSSKCVVLLNGYQIVGATEVTQSVAQLDRTVAITDVDTLRVTVAGSGSPFVTISMLSTADSSFNVYGPNQYAIPSGSTKTYNETFSKATTAAAPYRVYVTNGATDGTKRVTSGSVTLNGTQVVTTTDLTSGVGSLTKTVTVTASNTLGVTVNGAINAFITVRFTATDTTKPTLTITAPAPGAITRNTSITVTGTISDQTTTTVSVNGTAATVTNNTSYSASVPLNSEGNNLLTITATDAGGHHTDSTRTVIRDTQAPSLSVSAPVDGAVTKNATITVTATASDANGVTVNTNGTPLTLSAGVYSGSVALTQGSNVLTTTATDGAGNTTSIVRNVTMDAVPPVLTVSAPTDGSTTMADSVTVSGTVSDLTAVTVAANSVNLPVTSGSFSGKLALVDGPNTINVVATDAATNTTTVTRTVTHQPPPPPPDPSTIATAIDPSVGTTIGSSTAFLYTGANAIQTGVAAGTIQATRAAVIRGKVLDRTGAALSNVTVTVLNHPEFGQTKSRADGMFDLAVNGGTSLVVNYAKSGYLSAQRTVPAPWQDFVFADSVAMIPLDTAATAIALGQSSELVARGSTVSDTNGSRRGTLLFAPGTTASMVLPGGGTQPLSSATVRVTEFTVGAMGPTAMPATLPPSSAYTYAAELSVDAALSAGATSVQFTQPVTFYLENYRNFPVGTAVPIGTYDRLGGKWTAEPDGLVIKVLNVTGGIATLAVDSTLQAATAQQLSALAITDSERVKLAGLYSAGQTLWRSQHTHFSLFDWNWALGLPAGAARPFRSDPQLANAAPDHCNCKPHSIIQVERQSLGEDLPIAGTPFALHYQSDRQAGYRGDQSLNLSLTGDTLPPNIQTVELDIQVAGIHFTKSFPNPTPNMHYTFSWNGRDGYGRLVQGLQPITVLTGYGYLPVYGRGVAGFGSYGKDFGLIGGGGVPFARIVLWQEWKGFIGSWTSTGERLGGWTLDAHHAYSLADRTVYRGDGTRVRATTLGNIIGLAAGNRTIGSGGDGGPATQAQITSPGAVAVGPGSLYIAGSDGRIRRVDPNGIISTYAGTGVAAYSGDGGPATQAQLIGGPGITVGPDGSVYFPDQGRIRKIDPTGIITRFAGTSTSGFAGDGGPATSAQLSNPKGVALGADGSLYIADFNNHRIRRVAPTGIITTIAGNGTTTSNTVSSGFTGPATSAAVPFPTNVVVAADGSLYIADGPISRVDQSGTIRLVAGGDAANIYDVVDGALASKSCTNADGLALAADGSLYFGEQGGCFGNRKDVRRLDPDGTLRLMVGNRLTGCSRSQCSATDGSLATQALLNSPKGLAFGPDGTLYIAEDNSSDVVKVAPGYPGLSLASTLVASEGGTEVYQFDANGRHQKTLDAMSGKTLLSFAYDSVGHVQSVTDGSGNVTTVQRNGSGQPTGVLAAFGQLTTLTTDGAGNMASVADPAGQVVRLYASTSAAGILDSLVDPRGGRHPFVFDTLGRLLQDSDPAGGSVSLALTSGDTSYTVTESTALGRTTTYQVTRSASGAEKRVVTPPTTLATTSTKYSNDSTVTTTPDGTVTTSVNGKEPRFGVQAPVLKQLRIALPSGLASNVTGSRVATLATATDLFSLTAQTDSLVVNGNLFLTGYDPTVRRYTATSPEGRQSFTTVDSLGRAKVVRTPGLDSLVYSYDSHGRLSQVQTGGRVVSYAYDSRGRLLSTTDPVGRQDSLFYDSADRLTRHVLPGGREVDFAYDSSGNLTSVTPPGRTAHGFGYTKVDLDSLYTPPSLGSGSWATQYTYNADRQLTQISRPDTTTIGFGYDTAGRPSTVTFDRGQLGFGYSGTTGQLTSVTAPGSNTLTYTYDGVVPKTVTWAGTVAGSVGVGYNSDFRVTSQTVNGANSVTFGYDRDGLLTAAGALGVKRNAQTSLLDRDSVGSVLGVWSYDPRGDVAGYTASSGATTLFQTGYVRDSLSRVTQLTETVQGTTSTAQFSYDSAGRLATVTRNGTLTASYQYDANGNRQQLVTPNGTLTGAYDAQDRLTQYGTTSYGYSRTGALAWKAVGTDTTKYTYDALGNLNAVRLPDGSQVDYVIDGQNRRVGKKVNGALVQGFLYQGQLSPIAELDGTGALVSRFVYATQVNVPEYMVKGGQTYRLVVDHLRSVRLVVNTTDGTVAQRIDYDEYGQVTQNTNPGFQPFGYAGGLFDSQTGLVRFGARDYAPDAGRWTAPDPLGFGGRDANVYAYAFGDPLGWIDPTGDIGIGVQYCVGALAGLPTGVGFAGSFCVGIGVTINDKTGAVDIGAPFYSYGRTHNAGHGDDFATGFGATLGTSFYATDATCFNRLLGPFRTIDVYTPGVGIQAATDGTTDVLSAGVGNKFGAGIASYQTNTGRLFGGAAIHIGR